jgi:hypothetical protein
MTRHNVDYKKIRTDIINGKKRCIYMKPKGKREYVKSGGEFVSLSAYIKTLQKKNKKKVGGMLKCFGIGKKACNDEREEDTFVSAELGFVNNRTQDHQVDPHNNPHNNPRNITTKPQPDEWVEMQSRSKNASYLFNRSTGESRWKQPSPKKYQHPITHSTAVTRVFRI